jgi:hypothetical protein
VSSFDGQDLGQRLGEALATITGPVPAPAIVARGRRIRRRRRLVRAGAVAVVAAAAVALPGLVHTAVRSGPPGPSARQLTITKLGPIARNGVIGSGTADGQPWTVRLADGPDPVAEATGLPVAEAAGLPTTGRLGTRPAGSDPVTWHIAGSGAWRLLAGPVRSGVAYLTMRLAGGITYRLWPVAWHGHEYVGLVVPWNLPLARFTAYTRHGELAYAIPYPNVVGFPRVVSWLRPGAVVPAVSSATVASGKGCACGGRWYVQVQVGPWGTCLLDYFGYKGIWCRPAVSYPPNAVILVMSGPLITERAGITGRAVTYIQLWLRNGKTARLHVLHIGGQGFYALSVVAGQVAAWTAYTTTGRPVASGTGIPG